MGELRLVSSLSENSLYPTGKVIQKYYPVNGAKII
jgi:hypothetical protein